MAVRAVFYHLTRSGVEETLLMILTRAQGAGWPVMVRGCDTAKLAKLDGWLWSATGDEGFLPHGMEGGQQDAVQPILLGQGALPAHMQGLVLIDGADAEAADVAGLERVWVLFDGGDEAQVQGARGLWTKLTAGGIAAQYWTEDSGKWAMKVEKLAQN